MSNVLINDGYTRKGTILSTPFYGGLEFTYRPARPIEQGQYLDRCPSEGDTKGNEKERELLSKVLCAHISSWSISESVTYEQMIQVFPSLWKRLVSIVIWCQDLPDILDEDFTNSKNQLDGEESIEELLAKNSQKEPTS